MPYAAACFCRVQQLALDFKPELTLEKDKTQLPHAHIK
jgi:hypothetical protein